MTGTLKMKWIACLLVLPLLLCGCTGDDVNDIFTGKRWHWGNSYETRDWEDDNKDSGELLSLDEWRELGKDLEIYNVVFDKDGTLQGIGKQCRFKGNWEADGKKNTFAVSGLTLTEGNLSGKLDKMFFESVKNAKYYRGNSIRWLKLFNADRNEYIMFSNIDN